MGNMKGISNVNLRPGKWKRKPGEYLAGKNDEKLQENTKQKTKEKLLTKLDMV